MSGTIIAATTLQVNAFEITDDISGYLLLNLLSDYRSNGISQTQGDPAIQAELGAIHSSGALVGLWTSSVDFGTKTRMENGAFFGFTRQLTDDLNVTATFGRFIYPKNSTYTLNEAVGTATYKKWKASFVYDFDMHHTPNAQYRYLGYNFTLPYDVNLYLEGGYHDVGRVIYSESGKVRENYSTKKATLSKSIYGVDWSATFIDTSLSKTECLYMSGTAESCSAGFIIGASKTF